MRPKGSKNKPKGIGPLSVANSNMGNPAFNINDAEPINTLGTVVAPGAVLPEDLELDRTLQSMTAQLPPIDDNDPTAGVVRKEVEKREMLGDAVDNYTPASTHAELQEQAALAVAEGCDSIEAMVELAKRICRDPNLEKVGFFTYHGVKVYLVGKFEEAKKRNSLTIEQKLFGKSTEAERKEALSKQITKLQEELNAH